MIKAFLLAMAITLPVSNRATDKFDRLEVNVLYNEYGGVTLIQLIYWDRVQVSKGVFKWKAQGWKTMPDAFDETDEEHRKAHENRVEELASKVRDYRVQIRIREKMKYKGKFVGGKLFPRKDRSGNFSVNFFDDRTKIFRTITAPDFVMTHTLIDPERENRERFPAANRRRLTVPKLPKEK